MEKLKKKFDYNIVVIGLCFLMILFGLGFASTSSLFLVPITSELEISRSAYSVSDTMRFAATAIVNMFFGALIEKFGSKKLICAGFLLLILSSLFYALADGLFFLYVGGFLLGVGLSWTSTTIVGYVVNKACRKNRGTIMGFVLAANGFGSALSVQILAPFISDLSNPAGYRNAFFVKAGIFLCMFLILLFFYKEPKSEGVEDETPKKKARGESWVGIDFAEARKKNYFYGACVCIFFTGFVLHGCSNASIAHMTDVGLDLEVVTFVTTLAGLLLAAFKFLNGFMYDKMGLRATVSVDCVSAIGFILCLFFMTNSTLGIVLAIICTVLKAVALPLETIMLPIYANDLFGEKSFNKVLGIFISINQIGYMVGGIIVNALFDLTGSYHLALLICAIVMFGVIVALQFIINSARNIRKRLESSL